MKRTLIIVFLRILFGLVHAFSTKDLDFVKNMNLFCFSLHNSDDKVTVLESEKRAWDNSPEAQAVRDALNPWRHIDAEGTERS